MNPYLHWIAKHTGLKVSEMKKRETLFNILLKTEYIYDSRHISLDINRIYDGLKLRTLYMEEMDADYIEGLPSDGDMAVGVLEVLAALSCRIDDEYLYDGQKHSGWLLWKMLDNLNLLNCDDFSLANREPKQKDRYRTGYSYIKDILDYWMNRNFEPDGYGSPFPLKNPLRNQKNVQLWDQAIAYVGEHFA